MKLWQELKTLGEAWGRYECSSLAAGVAFYAGLSVFPLVMVMISGVGFFFRFVERGRDAGEEIRATISQQMSPELGEAVSNVFAQVQDRALVNGPLAGLMLLFSATLVFFQIDRAFYRIWEVRQMDQDRGVLGGVKRMLWSRARSLGLMMGACLVVVVIFVSNLLLRTSMSVAKQWFVDLSFLHSLISILVSVAINL
ncbi:MAG: YihY/virulence factor BrkB family protein, partial [Verrucomicrobiales bacterium]